MSSPYDTPKSDLTQGSESMATSEQRERYVELEITWGRVARVWWAQLWRNLIAAILMIIPGGLVGALLGGIMGAAGASVNLIRIVVAPIGVLLGFAATLVVMKLII